MLGFSSSSKGIKEFNGRHTTRDIARFSSSSKGIKEFNGHTAILLVLLAKNEKKLLDWRNCWLAGRAGLPAKACAIF
jgi:hypothetical protein